MSFRLDSQAAPAPSGRYVVGMKLTLEITVESIEDYLQLLNVLDRAEERGELDFEFTASPSTDSFPVIADHIVSWLHAPS